jgi:hypothetical protein
MVLQAKLFDALCISKHPCSTVLHLLSCQSFDTGKFGTMAKLTVKQDREGARKQAR